MRVRCTGAPRFSWLVVAAVCLSGCGGVFGPTYEYEEDLSLSLDGSAAVNVSASVAALVALRGADLDADPGAEIDRESVQRFFEGQGATPSVRFSRRNGRPFVRVRVEVDDVTRLTTLAPFSWSSNRFERRGDLFEFRQMVGTAAGATAARTGWTGAEMVRFRVHVPSAIRFHDSPSAIQRGNILQWEQPLVKRLEGEPLDLLIHMETNSILGTTLLLFGSAILAVAIGFAVVVWWTFRRGRRSGAPGPRLSHPGDGP